MKYHSLLKLTMIFVLTIILVSCEEDLYRNTSPSLSFDADGVGYNSGEPGIAYSTSESYNEIVENSWQSTDEEAISTFSIDADGGSYSNVRRFLEDDLLPPTDAIRTEELINFFQYDYDYPTGNHPIALNGEITECPWSPDNKLLRIGIKGKHLSRDQMPPANFVFLIDVSGSMGADNKLPLLKESFKMFAEHMRDDDRIAIVTYAGSAGVHLQSTAGNDTKKIKKAIKKLESGGRTNGAAGIVTAYRIAQSHFIKDGNNRVIIGTDGDFNVGISNQEELVKLIEEKRESGVFLSVLGVGTGNYQEGTMEQLANNGNGTYEYIDDIDQARKVFVEEMGKFYTVAKDVKVQIEFDSWLVDQYRLIGYENRLLETEDFEDDTKDAGEIGANQAITAIYELKMKNYAGRTKAALTIDFRYKEPTSDLSELLQLEVFDNVKLFRMANENTRFATAVAGYGLMLRDSEYKGDLEWDDVLRWADDARDYDPNDYRKEFIGWIEKARDLSN